MLFKDLIFISPLNIRVAVGIGIGPQFLLDSDSDPDSGTVVLNNGGPAL
jgi:hypothetical protein